MLYNVVASNVGLIKVLSNRCQITGIALTVGVGGRVPRHLQGGSAEGSHSGRTLTCGQVRLGLYGHSVTPETAGRRARQDDEVIHGIGEQVIEGHTQRLALVMRHFCGVVDVGGGQLVAEDHPVGGVRLVPVKGGRTPTHPCDGQHYASGRPPGRGAECGFWTDGFTKGIHCFDLVAVVCERLQACVIVL